MTVEPLLGGPTEGDWLAPIKVRQNRSIVSVALGVNTDGRCEVLGINTILLSPRSRCRKALVHKLAHCGVILLE
jgi:hypothetical protein